MMTGGIGVNGSDVLSTEWTFVRTFTGEDWRSELPFTDYDPIYGERYQLRFRGLTFIVTYQYWPGDARAGRLGAVRAGIGVEITHTSCCDAMLKYGPLTTSRWGSHYCSQCGQRYNLSDNFIVVVDDESLFSSLNLSRRHSTGPTHEVFTSTAGEWFEGVAGEDTLTATVSSCELFALVRHFAGATAQTETTR